MSGIKEVNPIAGSDAGSSCKAQKLNIEIIDEDKFIELSAKLIDCKDYKCYNSNLKEKMRKGVITAELDSYSIYYRKRRRSKFIGDSEDCAVQICCHILMTRPITAKCQSGVCDIC